MAYSKEQIEKLFIVICERITKGEAVRNILKDKDMPAYETFYNWLNDENKAKQYARATEIRAEAIFDEMFEIADDGTNDYGTKILLDGSEIEVLNSEHIQRSRLRIDTRKWALSKMNPKKYGDKIETKNEHSGEITITRIVKK